MSTLSKYRKNIYSQNGEDGVIREICSLLNIKIGFFVEFGAWDGKHFSNTYHLLEQGWKGVYIEGDERKFSDLLRNTQKYRNTITLIQTYVQAEGEHCLDSLLSSTNLEKDFDLLSIDIDSYDWHVWKSLQKYNPKILLIEINSSIPVGIYQTHRNSKVQGSSFTATIELGKEKGYVPVCHTGNLIFVKKNLVEELGLPEEELQYPELLFNYDWKHIRYESITPVPLRILTLIYNWLRKFIGHLIS